MNRREILAALAVIGAIPAARAHAASGDLRSAAREAWLYGLPLIEMATARARALAGPDAVLKRLNTFGHGRHLAGPQSRSVTTPNNDTLYSRAWVDLSRGPVTMEIPPTGDRYISVAGMNMFTDNDFVLGTRTTGGAGGRYTIVGPGQAGEGPDVVRLKTPEGWVLVRILVDGPDDLPAVHKLQDGLRMSGPAAAALAAFAERAAPPLEYFASVARLLKANPPPATDGALFGRTAALGLTARGGFDPKRFDAAAMAEIAAGVAEAQRALRGMRPGAAVQGWSYPRTTLGDFNQDYLFRAAVALGGLAALPPAEAMYMQPVAEQGRMITGAGPYRLHFPADRLPAVDAFWSLTMYEATPDGQFFLVENPIRRYSIGDRTPGLRKNADGSLTLWIARSDPGGDRSPNWLPAPPQGPFSLSFRAYLPNDEFRDGRYRLPALETA
ncbi:DUF1254 domain-containing protein [Phenylobacterium sp. SCN 70-31]|uniref:DUF1254 domain-containing protein n=1 Tax=Phenylobacterium sp. SCN 70-31 TaxID=1660129 RepID=UPI00086B30ED|nr:DUF1254 domain-containing protein [Phenylobacterium sp. SCN 70-31]ODT88453.1 MAG: phosphatidylserine decarboxylase [Phenylobacterium sp. SCN 70-31]